VRTRPDRYRYRQADVMMMMMMAVQQRGRLVDPTVDSRQIDGGFGSHVRQIDGQRQALGCWVLFTADKRPWPMALHCIKARID